LHRSWTAAEVTTVCTLKYLWESADVGNQQCTQTNVFALQAGHLVVELAEERPNTGFLEDKMIRSRRGTHSRPQGLILFFTLCLVVACVSLLCKSVWGADASEQNEEATTDAAEGPTIEVTVRDEGVSVYAVNADARKLLTELAETSGLQLIVDDTVDRTLTVNLVDKQPRAILDSIIDAYGLSLAEVGEVLIVSEGLPKSASSYLMGDIAAVTTKYVRPEDAKKLLPAFLQGHVGTNLAQNSVVLSAPAPVLRKFREDVEQFDIPAAQIMLDVLVVEFTDIDFDEFNAQFGWSNQNLGITTDSLTGQTVLTAVADLPSEFFVELQALARAQKARVRANPRVATVSGRPASVFIGQEQYLSTPVSGPYGGSQNSISAGVRLSMTPLTGGAGEIILDLNVEVSTLGAPDPTTGLPNKTTRSADTTVRVHDGDTIIIGGLGQEELRMTRRKIPLLGDIPIIGQLFRSKRREQTKVDLAVFITANLLSPTGHLPPEQEQAMRGRVGMEPMEEWK